MKILIITFVAFALIAWRVPEPVGVPDEAMTTEYVVEHWLEHQQVWSLTSDPNIVFGIHSWPDLEAWAAASDPNNTVTCKQHCWDSLQFDWEAANTKYKEWQVNNEKRMETVSGAEF